MAEGHRFECIRGKKTLPAPGPPMSLIVILRSRSTAGLEPRIERAARALQEGDHDVRVFLWDRERAYPRNSDPRRTS